MSRSSTKKFSANEKEIAELLEENQEWGEDMSYAAEEINFFNLFLTGDIFKKNVLNLYERLRLLSDELEDLKSENRELSREVHNHRYDIEGMLECEDIGCEVFYHEQYLKLGQRIINFTQRFRDFKLQVYSHTGHLLRKSSKEH
ncbi:MAG: hypothetical protein WBL21_14050 [Salinimicrobium sp.]